MMLLLSMVFTYYSRNKGNNCHFYKFYLVSLIMVIPVTAFWKHREVCLGVKTIVPLSALTVAGALALIADATITNKHFHMIY